MAIEEAPLMAEPAVRVPAKGVSDEHERTDPYCLSVPAALADKLQNVLTKSYSIHTYIYIYKDIGTRKVIPSL